MSIDTLFIPCAGKGTRMGELGKKLPKPLWPLFESTLLEFQIDYFKRLGFNKFIINTHHLASLFNVYKDTVDILFEPELLGSGGSLHNIKRKYPDLSKILISNPDVIYNLADKEWMDFFKVASEKEYDNYLLGLECQAGAQYNELVVNSEGEFEKIESPPSRPYLTYSGIGVVNLDSFPSVEGESSFFQSVINPKINTTKVVKKGSREDYWDFGTLELYCEKILFLIQEKSNFRELLEKMNVFDNKADYLHEKCINLGQLRLSLGNENVPLSAQWLD